MASENQNQPVEFGSAAERAEQAAKEAAHQMEDAARQAATSASAASEASATPQQESQQSTSSTFDELTAELNRMGTQVAGQAKAAWESEQRKELQDQLVKGLSSVATAVEEQVKKLAANTETQRFLGKVEEATNKVVEQARGSRSLQEAAEAVMKGLNSASTAIEKWLSQQQAPSDRSAPTPPTPEEAQEITIERPATPAPPVPPAPPSEPGDKPTYL